MMMSFFFFYHVRRVLVWLCYFFLFLWINMNIFLSFSQELGELRLVRTKNKSRIVLFGFISSS